MIRQCLLLLASTSLLFGIHQTAKFEELSDQDGHVLIKVLLQESDGGALVDIDDGYKVYNPQTGKVLSSAFSGKRYRLQANAAGLKWGEGYPGVHQIKIVPKNKDAIILVDGIQYKGSIEAYDVNGTIEIVNEIDVEDLLRSTLSTQLSKTDFHNTTYDSIAIIARTNLYHAILSSTNPFWHVQANDIGYAGQGAVSININVDRSVRATEHLIMTYKDRPFAAGWTDHSGGRTASYENIYRKKEITPEGVFVAYAQKMREESRWKCTLSFQEIARTLKLKSIQGVDLFQDPESKKVYAVRFTDQNSFVELTVFDLRKLLGESRILSNDFSIRLIKDHIQFDGYGKGYGVGLCLFTADQMAKIGDTMPQVLSYFFPSTHLVKLSYIPESLLKPQGAEDEPS